MPRKARTPSPRRDENRAELGLGQGVAHERVSVGALQPRPAHRGCSARRPPHHDPTAAWPRIASRTGGDTVWLPSGAGLVSSPMAGPYIREGGLLVTYWTAGLPDVATTSRAAPTAVLGLLRQAA